MGMCIANDAMCIHGYDDIIIALQIIHEVFFQKARHNPIATKYHPAQIRSMHPLYICASDIFRMQMGGFPGYIFAAKSSTVYS